MSKIVTMHQPNYLPWIGLFSRIKHSNCFIMVDQVQYEKYGFTNRNKIRTNTGWMYLTIPIDSKFHFSKIKDIMLPSDRRWQNTHWKNIYGNYAKTNFFTLYRDFFEKLYLKDFKYLWEINVEIILYLLKCFEINVEILKDSDMDIDRNLHKSDMLIALAKASGADTFLVGPSGKNYMDFEKFARNNIDIKFFKFEHPVYKQRFPGFIPNMSAIDLLFNMGPEASRIIEASGSFEHDIASPTHTT